MHFKDISYRLMYVSQRVTIIPSQPYFMVILDDRSVVLVRQFTRFFKRNTQNFLGVDGI